MPTRARRICQSCRTAYVGRCPTCAERRKLRNAARAGIDPQVSPYNTKQWRDMSRQFLAEHRFCECPKHAALPYVQRPASQIVDHIDGLGPDGPRGFDESNLQALTRSCHQTKTNRHDGGQGNPIRRMVPPPIRLDDPPRLPRESW